MKTIRLVDDAFYTIVPTPTHVKDPVSSPLVMPMLQRTSSSETSNTQSLCLRQRTDQMLCRFRAFSHVKVSVIKEARQPLHYAKGP